jgi:hypothetical protein
MTSAEILATVKRLWGAPGMLRLSDTDLYGYINDAKDFIEARTNLAWKGDVPIIHGTGDGTFDLSDNTVIQLTTGCSLRKLLKLRWDQQPDPLVPTNLFTIKYLRASGQSTTYPALYSLHTVARKPTLDIWVGVLLAADTFVTSLLRADITEKTPAISESQDPVWPDYGDGAVVYKTLLMLAESFGNRRWELFNARFNAENYTVINMSNERSAGEVHLEVAQ